MALDTVTRGEFEACLHEIFSLVLKDGKFPLELAKVAAAGSAAPGAKRDPFSITFRAAQPVRIPQSSYVLEHERLGQMEIFLVPISATDLQAVFS